MELSLMFVKPHHGTKVSSELIKCKYGEYECDFDIPLAFI